MAQSKALGVTTGAAVLMLPSLPAGPTSSGPAGANLGIGASFGIDGVIEVAPVAGFDGEIGLSLWSVIGTAGSVSAQTYSGPGVVVIPGYATPANSSITLTTSSGGGSAGGNSTVTHAGESQPVNVPSATGATDAWGVNPGDGANVPSFIYGGVFKNGDTNRAAAFGAVAAADGGVFVASGDLTGLTVTTTSTRNFIYSGGDITLGLGGSKTADTRISAFAGPSARFMGQSVKTDVVVDIPELTTLQTFALYTDSRTEDLSSLYYGISGGVNMSRSISDDVTLNLGGKLGVYAMNTSFKGAETYSVTGGAPATANETVALANGPTASDFGAAYALGANASVSKAVNEKMDIGFGFGADFLSRVATLSRSSTTPNVATTVTPGNDDGTTTYTSVQSFAPVLSFGSMITWKATASLTGHF